jgi:oxepin-CoA hydrolase/3-oxo-5,6-dehydrosuberyl-CoA semialdehyde dehydrogenase
MNIYDRTALTQLLNQLTENSIAHWGVMKPQNMIEHLAMTLQFSNGKKQATLRVPEDKAKEIKHALIYTDVEIPKGVKSPLIESDGPEPFLHVSLEEAKQTFFKELDDFQSFHANNPEALFIQPRMGPLTEKEWLVFHGKHFTHHFKQFGLIEK